MLSRSTKTASPKRKRWLAVLCLLGVFGAGAYGVYTANGPGGQRRVAPPSITPKPKPAKRELRSSARFVYRESVPVAAGLRSFRIRVRVTGAALYPGAPPQAIRITLSNPNDVSIFVTKLTVTVRGGPAGCSGATNVSLVQSNVSSADPIEIPAHGAATLPAQGRSTPTIQLRNRPVNQDACENTRFPLGVTGSAHS